MNDEPPAVNTWVLIADRRVARLLRLVSTTHGRLHLEEQGTLREEWDEVEHARPSARSGKTGHHYAGQADEEGERIHRFAKEVSTWTETAVREQGIRGLHLFAAHRFLGELRPLLSQGLRKLVSGSALDLARLQSGELAEHPAIVALAHGSDGDRGGAPAGSAFPRWVIEDAAFLNAARALREEHERLSAESGPKHGLGRLAGMLRMFSYHLEGHASGAEEPLLEGGAEGASLLDECHELQEQLLPIVDAVERASAEGSCLSDAFVEGLGDLLKRALGHGRRRSEFLSRQSSGAVPASGPSDSV